MDSKLDMANSSISSAPLIEKNDDEATRSLVCCRICFERNTEYVDDELISPCMCEGPLQHVHRSCLDHWRLAKKGFDFSQCISCGAQFHLKITTTFWRDKVFSFYSARDKFLESSIDRISTAVMGSIAYFTTDKDGNLRNSKFNNLISRHPVISCLCVGYLGLLLVLGLFALFALTMPQTIANVNSTLGSPFVGIVHMVLSALFLALFVATSQNILSIRDHNKSHELTQEYIVMDRRGSNVPPKLAPQHEERLRMLGLF